MFPPDRNCIFTLLSLVASQGSGHPPSDMRVSYNVHVPHYGLFESSGHYADTVELFSAHLLSSVITVLPDIFLLDCNHSERTY